VTRLLTSDPATSEASGRPPPPPWRPVLVLAGREARLLQRHPATKVGMGLAALAWFAVYFEDPGADALFDPANTFALPVLMLAFSLIVGANLGALRTRRAGADELVESLPLAPAARTTAHLLGGLVGVPLAAGALVAALAVWQLRPATIGAPPVVMVVALLLVVAGAAVTGVLVARWVPHPAFGAIGVVAVVVLQSNFGHESETLQWLHFLPMEYTSIFEVGPLGWHAAYLFTLVLLGAAVTVARHGLRRPVAMVLAAAVAGVVITGWIQVRPMRASAVAHQADRLEHPAAHQVCERHGAVRYCAYPAYRSWIGEWREPVDGVLARLPAPGRALVTEVRQRAVPTLDLGGPVADRIDPRLAWPADGQVHPPTEWHRGLHDLGLAYQVAARALGLPTVVDANLRACSAGGQARAVVALWLAGQATPQGGRDLVRRAGRVRNGGRAAFVGLNVTDALSDWASDYPDLGGDYAPELGSGGRGADVVAAEALLELRQQRVAAVVSQHWDLLRDPTTPASEVFRLLGAAPPTGYAALPPVRAGLGRACA
jgi:hypothetical protein